MNIPISYLDCNTISWEYLNNKLNLFQNIFSIPEVSVIKENVHYDGYLHLEKIHNFFSKTPDHRK
jgi:hypothetical protein